MPQKLNRTHVFITLMLGAFLAAMSVTTTSTMLPAIMKGFGVPASTAQWLTSGATLASGVTIPIAAYLIKRFSGRVYFVAAMALFSAGSLLCAAAPAFWVLLGGRLLQAVSCGLLMPFTQLTLMAIYPPQRHGAVIGAYSLCSTFAPVVAPSLAGLMVDWLGWASMFWLMACLGAFITVQGALTLRRLSPTEKGRFPLAAATLSTLGFSGLLIGLGNLAQGSVLQLQTGGALLVGLCSLGLFIRHQLRAARPLLNLRVLCVPAFGLSVLLSMLMYLICMGNGILLPLFAQTSRGYSAAAYAFATLPGALVMAVLSLLAGKLYDRSGPKLLLLGSGAAFVAGSLLGLALQGHSTLLHIGLVSCLLSTGTGLLTAPVMALGLGALGEGLRVDGSSLLNTLRQIASSLGATLAVLLYTVVSRQAGPLGGLHAAYGYFLGVSALLLFLALCFLKPQKAA